MKLAIGISRFEDVISELSFVAFVPFVFTP